MKHVTIKLRPHGSNPSTKPLGILTVLGRSKKKAVAKGKRLLRRLTNVSEGFYDSTGFHPIRASKDYSKARAGEGRARSRKAVATRVRSKMRKARRGRTAIS
jgi:hypothetical protein